MSTQSEPRSPFGVDPQHVVAGLPQAVPFVRTLSISVRDVVATDDGRLVATAALPDAAPHHNHVGGPHAGAMFTLGESASGAVVLAGFGDLMGRATPLAVEATIRYLKLAMGDLTATATLTRPVAEVRAELEAGQRPEFGVDIELTTADGTQTGAMAVTWTLRPNR